MTASTAITIALFCVCVLLAVLGIRNLMRAEKSPHWMWLFLLNPLFAVVIFLISLGLVRRHQSELTRQEARSADERRRQEAESRKRAEEEHVAAQSALAFRLDVLVSDSTEAAATLPKLVQTAEKNIDLAEQEFQDGAFAPFWDAIERAATGLAHFEATTQRLIQDSDSYTAQACKLDAQPRPFRIGLQALPNGCHTADRMRAVVRRAQKDFHFATIYEQRKTNQLLTAGFRTLGQAVNELRDRLGWSLERLAASVSIGISDLSSDIAASHERMTSRFAAGMELSREQAATGGEDEREHRRKELEMLDNIQRRRKPVL